jgi:hypothetical protein
MASLKKLLALSLLTTSASLTACSEPQTKTNTNEAGPPMVRQVRLGETVTSLSGSRSERRVFAFGTHPDAPTETKDHPVLTANPLPGNPIRIVMDELLVGNYLERIACRDNSYSDVPVGATPDDIAGCAEGSDLLPVTCKGEFAVCIGPSGDGAADFHQFIPEAVQLVCGGKIVPLDVNKTFWQPAGNQQLPAGPGIEALGPAIVLIPEKGMPAGKECVIQFGESVVDRDNNRVCAPAAGDVTKDCAPGDTSAIKFTVEALKFFPAAPTNNSTGVSRDTQDIIFAANAELDPATLANIKLSRGGTILPLTPKLQMRSKSVLTFDPSILSPNAVHTITVPSTVTDLFGSPATPFTLTFTTGA